MISILNSKIKVRYWGVTDDVTECQCCGRRNLKKTVMLLTLDEDGNPEEMTYYGTGCAAKAMGFTALQVRREAERAHVWRMKRTEELGRIFNIYGVESSARTKWNEWRRHNGLLLGSNFYHPDREGFGEQEFITAQVAAWRSEYAELNRTF